MGYDDSMQIEYDLAEVDEDGFLTHMHVASHHIPYSPGGAEMTLCGKIIVYENFKGAVEGAPSCIECEWLDG